MVMDYYPKLMDIHSTRPLSSAMRRFTLSYDDRPGEDAFLDRWMALEMLPDPGGHKPKYLFRGFRLALVIEEDIRRRREIVEQMRTLANVRGEVVHGGARLHFMSEHLDDLTRYLRCALLSYAKLPHSSDYDEIAPLNDMLDGHLKKHLLKL
ncbi:hypothetical protein KJ567_05235, partial [Candidatus Bipolaricaulota bacterium]|nr:hypothetical protein [Candidatus Bipolaricaulota bacterium]